MKNVFNKEKKAVEIDDKFKVKLNLIATKIAEDPSFKDKEVYMHPNIKNACQQDKEKVCWECAGVNCYIRQQHCYKVGPI